MAPPRLHHRFKFAGAEAGAETDIRPIRDWNDSIVARSEGEEPAGVTGSILAYSDTDPDKLDWIPPAEAGMVLTSAGPAALPTWAAASGGGVKAAFFRITHDQLLILESEPVILMATPSDKISMFLSAQITSHIVVPYDEGGLVDGAYMVIQRFPTGSDLSAVLMQDVPNERYALAQLLTLNTEFMLPSRTIVDALHSYAVPLSGDDNVTGMALSLRGTTLTGGSVDNYLDLIVAWVEVLTAQGSGEIS